MNTVFQLLVIGLTYALAAPAPEPYVVSRSPAIQFSRTNTEILGQISQHNDDGSYTFGYESADGSFRVENRDIDGFVTGKYGYIDPNGEVHEFEYVAGSTNGQSLGYQVRGTSLPEANRAKVFPTMYPSVSSVDQRNRDYAYMSVDDDRDGFPDSIFDGSLGVRDKGQPNIVRVTTAPVQTPLENPSPILRVVKPGKVSSQQPSVVRISSSSQTSFTNPSDAVQRPSVVRLTSSDQSSYKETSNNVRLVNPATLSNQQQLVRLTSPKKTAIVQPTRVSGGNYQVIKQNRQRQPKVVTAVARDPYYSNYGTQRFVSRPSVFSNARINPLLSGQATTVRDNFGRWIVRGNNKFVPSIQTVIIDDDDLDDLNDFDDLDDIFDDDDTFLIGSSSLSMSAVSSNSSTSNTRTAPHSETNNNLANRMADLHNMYTVTDETNRNASDQHQPPPEYKWEDLPPSYEEAVAGSHSNPAFEQHEASTSASAGEATELSLTSPAQSA